jgi:integrase
VTELLSKMDAGSFFEASKATVKDFFEKEWLPQKVRDGARPATIIDYENCVRRYISPHVGRVRLCDLRPRAVQDLFNAWQDEGYSDATMELARTVLSMGTKQGVVWNYLRANPVSEIRRPKSTTPKRVGRSLTSAEAVAFIRAASLDAEATPYLFSLVTGLRPEETAGLRKTDIDLVRECDPLTDEWRERGVVRVRQVAVYVPKTGWAFLTPKTKNGVRDIYFPAHVYHALLRYAESRSALAKAIGSGWTEHGLLFPSDGGTPMSGSTFRARLSKVAKAAGISGRVTPYTLRYSFATLALVAGELDKTVSAQMGHARVNFTKDVYQKVLPEMSQGLSDRLESLLFSDGRTPLAHSEVPGEM